MAVYTRVVWGRLHTDEESELIFEKATEFVIAGKQEPGLTKDGDAGIKTFSDEQSAKEWLEFINSFNPPPISAEILVTD